MFIAIEGIDGSGKSTQSTRLAEWLEARTGRKTVKTFEPGGWPNGEVMRNFILNAPEISPMSELLLFLADRAEHVERVILPALRQDCNIVCERWNASTMAYQAGGHKIPLPQAARIISSCNFPKPDVTILLDIPPETAIARIESRKNSPDRFEAEGLAFMRNVASFYRLIADDDREHFMRILCDGLAEDEVFAQITAGLEARLWQSR